MLALYPGSKPGINFSQGDPVAVAHPSLDAEGSEVHQDIILAVTVDILHRRGLRGSGGDFPGKLIHNVLGWSSVCRFPAVCRAIPHPNLAP